MGDIAFMTAIAPKPKAFSIAGERSSAAARKGAALLLAMFGAALIFGVGFAGPEILHNTAHDTRHANGFPCH